MVEELRSLGDLRDPDDNPEGPLRRFAFPLPPHGELRILLPQDPANHYQRLAVDRLIERGKVAFEVVKHGELGDRDLLSPDFVAKLVEQGQVLDPTDPCASILDTWIAAERDLEALIGEAVVGWRAEVESFIGSLDVTDKKVPGSRATIVEVLTQRFIGRAEARVRELVSSPGVPAALARFTQGQEPDPDDGRVGRCGCEGGGRTVLLGVDRLNPGVYTLSGTIDPAVPADTFDFYRFCGGTGVGIVKVKVVGGHGAPQPQIKIERPYRVDRKMTIKDPEVSWTGSSVKVNGVMGITEYTVSLKMTLLVWRGTSPAQIAAAACPL